ncbi:hypothetical protein P154DRAFT_557495 [Amniculicola lignicola CBS 123094]|uniref:MFS general substrate transporter n=1 Tax=Amniculicola lignicola CBS 123094 TaxID=1392246 RepID=A0A6A5VY73_9PLEO|nr:hypothetical protein P154DRAFT_557495 [Amniculicola lignicola CBS 123094]
MAERRKCTPSPRRAPSTVEGKLAPGTTAKKLPWLDGKYSPSEPSAPNRASSNGRAPLFFTKAPPTPDKLADTPSIKAPLKNSPRPSGNPAIRVTGSTPRLRRITAKPPAELRISSIGASSPPPVTNRRLSLAPRTLATRKASPSLRSARSANRPRGFIKNANRRPPGVDGPESLPPGSPKLDGNPFNASQARRESLVSVPAHLERLQTPESVMRLPQTPTLMVVKSADGSPSQPAPSRSSVAQTRFQRLSSAIEGLEDLVQDAVDIAEADQQQVEEVYQIIEGATDAIKRASEPAQHLSPFVISGSSEEVSEFSTSDSSSDGEPQIDGLELDVSGMVPIPSSHNKIFGDSSILSPTMMTLEHPRGSVAIDFAYDPKERQSPDSPSTSSNNQPLLPHPQAAQTAPREQVEFVLRPSIVRNHSRGRSPGRGHHHHHRRSFRSRDHSSRSSHRKHESSSFTSIDEEAPRRSGHELSVREQARHRTFSLHRQHRRQPIARNWSNKRKRITASIACINTALLGIIVGIYAGEVPRIQYMLADERHHVIVGNVVLYFGLAISTFVTWPLPLLHGRKPYILASLVLALPLQFPQAVVVGFKRSPKNPSFRTGLLVARAASGLVFGFANVNFLTTLLDLFGSSLQSKNPHQEFVVVSDIRRHGGGMGIWLGIWSWCAIGSLAVGFQIGAGIIERLTPDWGFYVVVMILVLALVLNILAPETRRSAYRKSVTEVYDRDNYFITRRVARGEIKLHISTEGPAYWFEEVWAGMKLTIMMMSQVGFCILAFYIGWMYTQIVLVIVLLGALLSRDYKWQPRYVGLGVLSIAIGALLAVPLTKAGIFSRERKKSFRSDSMTLQKQVTWSSHFLRRVIFTLTLPLMGLAYTVSSAGRPKPYMVPIVFAGAVGFFSILAIAECHGLIMETFDTCDLQPGVNTRHRLQSMAVEDRRRRTNYSSFPRVSAGFFAAQSLGYVGAAVATEVGGIMTRHMDAQACTGITAGILLGLTILLTAVLWRFKEIQVIPNHTFGTRRDTKAWEEFKQLGTKEDWKPVVIGNPSGKMRRVSALELGGLSRWTEIRKLNFLIRDGEKKGAGRGW